jgi:hypothetical protein
MNSRLHPENWAKNNGIIPVKETPVYGELLHEIYKKLKR